MPRQFLPALRGFLAPRAAPPTETKAASLGGSYTSVTQAGTTNVWGTEGRADGWDMDRVVVEGYERSIWVFKAVEAISKHPGRLPVQIGRGGDDRDFEETLTDHPMLRLLNGRHANPLESGPVFRKRLSAQVLLSKRGAFVEVTNSRMGTPTRVDLLPPDRVQPIPDPRGDYISHFEFTTLDGRVRELGTERVRWIRDPHPTDPFSGITPLEAAGISVDLDLKSRTYNINFIRNDARPGGVLGIDADGLDPREMDRIQRRIAPGAHHAGEMTVVGTGPGGINYIDTSARPRDMAYETTSQTAKQEILAAFGVPESVVGNASERTYANADREEWNFWQHTELPHMGLILAAFAGDVEDDWEVRFDTAGVDALEFPRRMRRAEAREEWDKGLITADEYRALAQRPVFEVPHTRALWISPAKAPVPARPEDAAALGIGEAPGEESGAPPPGPDNPAAPPAEGDEGTAAQAVAQARQDTTAGPAAAAVEQARTTAPNEPTAGGSAAQDVATARAQPRLSVPGEAADAVAGARHSSRPAVPADAASTVATARGLERKALLQADSEYAVTDADFDVVHSAVTAALSALLARQEGVITARLRAPKTRKGTRFWQPDGPDDTRGGDAPMDMPRVVDAQRWENETTQTLTPVLQRAATAVAMSVTQALTGTGSVPPAVASAALGAAIAAGEALARFLQRLADQLATNQSATRDVEDVVALLRPFYDAQAPPLVDYIAEAAAVAAVNGAAEAAAASSHTPDEDDVVRMWVTQGDDRVRPAHRAVHGKTLPVGEPFTVGGFAMRYPGDPLAPEDLTVNCRCRLRYRLVPAEGVADLAA